MLQTKGAHSFNGLTMKVHIIPVVSYGWGYHITGIILWIGPSSFYGVPIQLVSHGGPFDCEMFKQGFESSLNACARG